MPAVGSDDTVGLSLNVLRPSPVFWRSGEGRLRCEGAPMLTVGKDAAGVERRLEEGRLVCPDCGGVLARWGHGRSRWVFGLGGGRRRVRPRRGRCQGCGVTHVLLPVDVLVRRRDEVAVFGVVLAAAARGRGFRWIAAAVGRPVDTVRGWLRRWAVVADQVRAVFTRLLVAVAVDPPPLEPAGSQVADAVVALWAAADAVGRRWPQTRSTVSPWEVASAVTSGTLLAPVIRPVPINTNSPLPIISD